MKHERLEQVITKTSSYVWIPRDEPMEVFEVSLAEAKQLWLLDETVQLRTKTRYSFVPKSTKQPDLQTVTCPGL